MSFALQSDTYTAAANGTTTDVSDRPFRLFSLQVTQTGTVTSWTVVLEGSLDNTTFTTILTHTNASGSGTTIFSNTNFTPVMYYRTRCSAIVLGAGTNVIAKGLGIE